MHILILNGPNLNMLGKREPHIYGRQSMDEIFSELVSRFPQHQLRLQQSNHEGALIDMLQEADAVFDAIVFNPGAYAHTSLALADAVRSISCPVIEVHISNIHARGEVRSHSYIAAAAEGVISGFGAESYALGIRAAETLKKD
ncbi:MAG TPA: type II 3-dehydroquinate dehydratase [Bacteroidales bacterium]|nr:type II 3-dehydroquinate dehydratase [Bacteroidales bacterium]